MMTTDRKQGTVPPKRAFDEWMADLTFVSGLGMLAGPNVASDLLHVPESWESLVQPTGAVLILRALLMYALIRRGEDL